MGRKVMVIDDDKEFLQELRETLSLSGYELIAVNDASNAVEMVHATKPDVILLDLKMPQKSGFQIADELRHLSEVSNIPIIAMSAYLKDDYSPLLNICGIKECLRKPFNPLDVIAKIEEVLAAK
ncbi:MAG: response regulator [Candidatus Omnitrophica bacterium]|nr:response regulator [Candidatus Omnitrophota bacterium]